MADEKNNAFAKTVFTTLCDVMERRGWKYEKDEKDLTETVSMDKSQYENETTEYSNNIISLQSVKHI